MQSILEQVFTSGLAFFRTTSGLVYICEYCEINGILTVITECWKLSHGGNFRHLAPSTGQVSDKISNKRKGSKSSNSGLGKRIIEAAKRELQTKLTQLQVTEDKTERVLTSKNSNRIKRHVQ